MKLVVLVLVQFRVATDRLVVLLVDDLAARASVEQIVDQRLFQGLVRRYELRLGEYLAVAVQNDVDQLLDERIVGDDEEHLGEQKQRDDSRYSRTLGPFLERFRFFIGRLFTNLHYLCLSKQWETIRRAVLQE